jgi:hypothetical protein
MKSANRLQKALASGSGASFGAWQMFPGANLSRAVARAGFDWVCVDCEHGSIAGACPCPSYIFLFSRLLGLQDGMLTPALLI